MINITNPANCCGCTSCANICTHDAITMLPDRLGFLYPNTDESKCVDCGLCEEVCPIIYRKEQKDYTFNIKESYAIRLKDKNDLAKSSSGGGFWPLVKYVINRGGVVCGAKYNDNMDVVHTIVNTLDEARQFQGSKYSQSNTIGIYSAIKKYLQSGTLVLFSGTPCQNDGLLRYLRKSYDNLITIDIICHSVPSPRYFKDYISFVESRLNGKLVDIKMRDKSLGWGKDSYIYKFSNGDSVRNPENVKCWQCIFESGYITRESCFECQYTNKRRVTDFTIGDFWDFDHLRPDLYSTDGTSVMLLNSDKALEIFQQIENDLLYWKVTPAEYEQPRLSSHSEKPIGYNDFVNLYLKKGFKKSYRRYFVMKQSALTRIKNKTKRIIKAILNH